MLLQFAILEIKEMTTELEQKTHCVNRCIEIHYECLQIPLSQAEIDLLSNLNLQALRQKVADLYQKQLLKYQYTSISETVHRITRTQKEKEAFFELSIERMTLDIENLKKKKRFKFW